MKQIIKIVQQIGNGGHIYLPKEVVGKKVVVSLAEKTIGDIEEEALKILKPYLRHVKGIYIHGSYARHEQTPESDIDILAVTDGKIKIKKKINDYEIISASIEQIEKTIKYTASLILPVLREARPILNQEIIEMYKKEKLTRKNTKWYIETTESSLKLAKYLVDEKDAKDMPSIVYSLIMRLRGLYMIMSLIKNKKYSNKEVTDYLAKNGIPIEKAKQLERMYREHRDNKAISENSLNYGDISKLYDIVCEYYQEIKLLWEKLE